MRSAREAWGTHDREATHMELQHASSHRIERIKQDLDGLIKRCPGAYGVRKELEAIERKQRQGEL